MEAAATITPESFSPIHLFLHADWVVKGVLMGLLFASFWSWAVILDKAFRFTALNRYADGFEDQTITLDESSPPFVDVWLDAKTAASNREAAAPAGSDESPAPAVR